MNRRQHLVSSPSICVVSLALVASLASCKGGSGEPMVITDDRGLPIIDGDVIESDASVPVADGEGIDILFVIDNSNSMSEEQVSLVSNFGRFISVLSSVEGGLPDIHIGVVSTNVGAGGYGITGCDGNGDNGLLQNVPRGACEAPTDRYISDIANADGGRTRNYAGDDLAATFSCIAELGISGCGFEQPLESMRRALNGVNVQNNGFLRPEALLAVVIISDEDDCSAVDGGLYNPDPSLDNADSTLGFLSSFRCFEFGVQCQPDDPREPGVKVGCESRNNSQFMDDVSEYADFLKGLKDNPGNIVVAGIIGNASPVTVVLNEGKPKLDASCTGSAGDAAPGIRLQAFLDEFPQRNTSSTICSEDLSAGLTGIAELLTGVLGN